MSDPVINQELDAALVAVEGTLYAIQAKVLEYLQGIELFRPVQHKFIEDSKTIDGDLDKALSQMGMSMMVSIGGADDKAGGVPGILMLDPLDVLVTVFENPTLNRGSGGSGLTVNRAIEVIATQLKVKRVGNAFLARPKLRLVDETPGGVLAKAVVFRLSATL